MKYIVLVGDGMADEPVEQFDGKTPLEVARIPQMDRLAREGELGMAVSVPEGYPPGSDVANLSLFGFDPAECYSGRSPLEAASMGVELGPDDVAFRMNLVCLEDQGQGDIMADFSAGHITSEEAAQLVNALQEVAGGARFSFYPGVSYRHLMVWHGGEDKLDLTPPHDISDRPVAPHLPKESSAQPLLDLMARARELWADHPVNRARKAAGKAPATVPWFWGQGRAPQMVPHTETYGISGAVISAVDLIKGIGLYAGLEVINVPGATGFLDTNYQGKADYAIEALKRSDYVYVHVEAPDEAAHAGMVDGKVQAIEDFDRLVVGRVLERLPEVAPARLMVLPDHPTPLRLKTHTSDPVPYILWSTEGEYPATAGTSGYTEAEARKTGKRMEKACDLMKRLIQGK